MTIEEISAILAVIDEKIDLAFALRQEGEHYHPGRAREAAAHAVGRLNALASPETRNEFAHQETSGLGGARAKLREAGPRRGFGTAPNDRVNASGRR